MSSGFDSLCVLLVDDNPNMRAIVGAVLHGIGIRSIVEAREGAHAMELLRHQPADFAMVDFLMQPVDGVHFTRMIRTSSDSPNVYLPIIMMTGHSERSRVMEARDAGVTEFVVKPLTAAALVARVNAIIHRPRPFIRTPGYFGPDRRRRSDPDFAGPFRRQGEAKAQAVSFSI